MNALGKFSVVAGLVLAAGLLVSQQAPPERVGPRPDGRIMLNSGWTIEPAGEQIGLSTLPMSTAMSPDGKHLLILQAGYLKPTVTSHDPRTLQQKGRIEIADAWLGLAFAPKSNLFYVGGGSQASVFEFELFADGRIEARRTFVIVPQEQRKWTDFIGDVQLSPDGRLIYAAGLFRDSIFVINPQSGMITEEWKTAHRPYRILFHPDGNSYFVTGWGDGTMRQHKTISGEEISRVMVGMAPMDMVWSSRVPEAPAAGEAEEEEEEKQQAPEGWPYTGRIFVVASNTSNVAVFGITPERRIRQLERINLALTPRQPAGTTPSALALSADEEKLYVVLADANAVAAADVEEAKSRVEGFIPTAWYPTAVRILPDKALLVLNGRGPRSYPNPNGPNPTISRAIVHEGNVEVQYVGAIQRGSASIVRDLSPETMSKYSATVLRNMPYRDVKLENAGSPAGGIVPAAPGQPTPIEHIIYVVKENRTYDQVFGDLGIGNGDPSLMLFGENCSPNHRKIAKEFVLLDNFYVNADVSADGHNWSSAAIAPAYVQRMWPNSYAGRRRHYDYEGGERAALPPAGYLWNNALMKGLSLRNYGWWAISITPPPASGPQISSMKDPVLTPATNFDFRGFDLDYPDTERVKVFAKDLQQWEKDGKMPKLILMRLGNDHTSGVSPGKISPRAAFADNDLAFGQLIEMLSKSRFWAKTAVFVLEDDAQNGPDHVDSHRSPAFIVSPYTRKRGIDSTMYNTVSILRTIELLTGLNPMTVQDAGARPMWAAFTNAPDLTPYSAVVPEYPRDERNPPRTPRAARVREFDFSEADRIDDDAMNEELWRALKGTDRPVPVRSFFGK